MFEFFFKYPAAAYRKGELLFATGWPVWLLLLLALAAAGALGWNMRRNPGRLSQQRATAIWTFQAALAALILFLLWQPALAVRSLRSQQNVVSVLLDTSRSMALGDGEKSRLQQAVDTLGAGPLEALQEKFRVRMYGFAGSAERLPGLEELPAPGDGTRLGEAVSTVLSESAAAPLGAIVVFSDGSDNSRSFDRDLMAEIRQHNVPVHTVGLGREEIPNDLELADVAAPTRALPGSQVSAQVTIRHPGEATTTRLSVRDGSKVLAAREVALRRGEQVQIEWIDFPAGEAGVRELRFALDPLPNEEIRGNNQLLRVMDVPRGRKRILYVEGEPRWEYKFMRRAINKDAGVQLVSLLRTSTNKYYRQGVDDPGELKDGFPETEEALFAYDALIIGSFEAAFFTPTQQQMIKDFVSRRGGALLMLAGRNGLSDGGWGASLVADALPVELPEESTHDFVRQKATVLLTPHGRDSLICRLDSDPEKSAQLWGEMPQVADYQRLGELKPAAVTLLEADTGVAEQPLLVTQRFGRGKSLVLATGGTWRWKMGLPHDDLRHHTFWRQLLRSLAADSPPPVVLSGARTVYADNPNVALRVEVRNKSFEPANNAVVNATITPENGEPYTVELHPSAEDEGVYEAETTAAQPGSYRIEATALSADGVIGSDFLHIRREDGVAEDFRPAQNRALLTRLAEQTGGRYWKLDELAGLPEEIRFSEAGITAREILDLWDMPALFLLLLAIKATEWLLRRKWGVL